jgi:sarcosine oxidase subunit gamma
MVEATQILRGDDIKVREDAPSVLVVRTRRLEKMQLDSLEDALGVSLPQTPNTCALTGDIEVCWMAPGEWALIGMAPNDARRRLERARIDVLLHIADFTDAWSRWRVDGPRARDVLAKGCSLDLHPRAFQDAQCAGTQLDRIHVLLIRQGDQFALHAERALSRHVWLWFEQATAELCVDAAEHRQ